VASLQAIEYAFYSGTMSSLAPIVSSSHRPPDLPHLPLRAGG
jgi:hypothetical protein